MNNRRQLTGNLHRRPICQVQAEYRPTHALNTQQVMLCHCFQMEALASLQASQFIFEDMMLLTEMYAGAATEGADLCAQPGANMVQ